MAVAHGYNRPPFLASLDMYRKVQTDMLEGTKRGSILSWFALLVMATLFTLETRDFLRTYVVKDLALDSNEDKRIRVNFNVTMMDLKCDFVAIDVVSVLGTEQNVTQHITKHHIDAEGVRQGYARRNKRQNDLPPILFDTWVTNTLEELHDDGEDALQLTPETFQEELSHHKFLFVDYYAEWCDHCMALMPTWETLAELMSLAAHEIVDGRLEEKAREGVEAGNWTDEAYSHAVHMELPVRIAKIDCVEHHEFCVKQGIDAFPTMKLYIDGKFAYSYVSDRTILGFTDFLAAAEKEYLEENGNVDYADVMARRVREGHVLDSNDYEEYRDRPVDIPREREVKPEWIAENHPGCQVSGFAMLDRVPGNLHILARSDYAEIVPSMTNVSHEINHLSFGDPTVRRRLELAKYSHMLPTRLAEKTAPMDGNVYVTYNLHEAHHHYLKVISTDYGRYRGFVGRAYQILPQSQLTYYKPGIVPAAKIQFDFSPVAVTYRKRSRKWYDYLTSLMAIIGGTFTVVGMIENSISYATTGRKKR